MWISRYVCLFMIYSFIGWIYETAFCTVSSGKWENRGFLYGPVCPIYGTGAVAISLVMGIAIANNFELPAWQIFLISVVGSMVIEYTTSWTLEKMFHAVWWDYSNLPFNLNGRISLFTTLAFGVVGLLVVYYIAPFTDSVMDGIAPIITEIMAFILVFIFAVDITLTVTVLLDFDEKVDSIESTFNNRMEMIVDDTKLKSRQIKQAIVTRSRAVNDQIYSLNGFTRETVGRIKAFRNRDKNKESIGNRILSKIREAIRNRDTSQSKEEENKQEE